MTLSQEKSSSGRPISRRIYIIALCATAGIFILGLLLGLVIENMRTSYIDNKYIKQELDFRSSQLQYEYLNFLEEKENCPAIYETLYANLEELEKTRVRVENYKEDATLTQGESSFLVRQYFLAEVRYWLLAQKAKAICNHDVVTVLSFYSDQEECTDCDQQSFVLTYMKQVLGERLLIFSFNVKTVDEPIIGILKTAYNITGYPSVVINQKSYAGFHEVDELLPEVCAEYQEVPEKCLQWTHE